MLGFCSDFGLNVRAANTGDFARVKPVGLDVERWARSRNHGEDWNTGTGGC